jgi:hypothetical protein
MSVSASLSLSLSLSSSPPRLPYRSLAAKSRERRMIGGRQKQAIGSEGLRKRRKRRRSRERRARSCAGVVTPRSEGGRLALVRMKEQVDVLQGGILRAKNKSYTLMSEIGYIIWFYISLMLAHFVTFLLVIPVHASHRLGNCTQIQMNIYREYPARSIHFIEALPLRILHLVDFRLSNLLVRIARGVICRPILFAVFHNHISLERFP